MNQLKKDFLVSYELKMKKGKYIHPNPIQGIRFDFWYQHEDNHPDKLFMIWPVFEDKDGNIIEDGPIEDIGTARMMIVNEKMVSYHKKRIEVGTIGYFMEGPIRIADCRVIELGNRLK